MKIESILLIRLSAIGDIVMASGVIPALRRKYTNAHIDWLVQSEFAPLFAATPELRDVIMWSRRQWMGLMKSREIMTLGQDVFQLAKTLRSKRYDLVIDMQGLFKSGALAFLAGGKARLGLGSKEGSQYLMTDVIGLPEVDKRISSEYKILLEKLEIDSEDYSIGIQPSQQDIHNGQALLYNNKITKDYAVICPFTTRAQKHWPEHNWLKLIPELQSEFDIDVVILGGPNDVTYSRKLAEVSGKRPANLTGKTSILESLAIIQGSSIVIGVDTGLTHMGMLSNIPTIAIFGSTCPYLEPDSRHGIVLCKEFSCSPCKRNPSCSGKYPCMHGIDEDMVLSAAKHVYRT